MSQHLKRNRSRSDVPIVTSLGGYDEPPKVGQYMVFLALSHTTVEHCLYLKMYDSLKGESAQIGSFSTRRLMKMTSLSSYSSIRRACLGLLKKLSIESVVENGGGSSLYQVFEPKEIFERRMASGLSPYPKEVLGLEKSHIFGLIGENVMGRAALSRREAVIALLCAEGMSNAAIGQKLSIDEDTVKFHLRHVYIKFGVKRRTELIGYLLSDDYANKKGTDKARS